MKKLFLFVLCLHLFFCPLSIQAEDVELMPQEEIAEVPALEQITEEALNDLFGEEIYMGETDWRGNKVSTKKNYGKKMTKR